MKIKVSIAVITHNSSLTVLETLDSILKQTYGSENIELIISDDCSTDFTVSIIESWVDEYHSQFLSVQVLKSSVNQGVAKNCNLAWQACSGDWIKTIAGDDLLMPNCIEILLEYVNNKTEIKWLFSDLIQFDNCSILNANYSYKTLFEKSAKDQFRQLIIGNFIYAPSSFINKEALKDSGYIDEKYKLIEDYPLWLKITGNNQRLDYIDKKTVKYRISESISRSKTKIVNEEFFLFESLVRIEYADKHLYFFDWLYWLCKWDHCINCCAFKLLSNKNMNVKRSLGHLIYALIISCSLLRYIRKIRYIFLSRF